MSPFELHLGGSAYDIGHIIRASVYLLPGEPHLTNWVGVPPLAAEASGSDEMLPPRACPLGINIVETFHAMYPNRKILKRLKSGQTKK